MQGSLDRMSLLGLVAFVAAPSLSGHPLPYTSASEPSNLVQGRSSELEGIPSHLPTLSGVEHGFEAYGVYGSGASRARPYAPRLSDAALPSHIRGTTTLAAASPSDAKAAPAATSKGPHARVRFGVQLLDDDPGFDRAVFGQALADFLHTPTGNIEVSVESVSDGGLVAVTARILLPADKASRATLLELLHRPTAELSVALDAELVKPPEQSPPPPPSPPPVVSVFVEGDVDDAPPAVAVAATPTAAPAAIPIAASSASSVEASATQDGMAAAAAGTSLQPLPPPPSPLVAAPQWTIPMIEVDTGMLAHEDEDEGVDTLLARTVSVRLVTASPAAGFPATALRAVLGARAGVSAKRVTVLARTFDAVGHPAALDLTSADLDAPPSAGAARSADTRGLVAYISVRCRDAEQAATVAYKLHRVPIAALATALGLEHAHLESPIVHQTARPPDEWTLATVQLPPPADLAALAHTTTLLSTPNVASPAASAGSEAASSSSVAAAAPTTTPSMAPTTAPSTSDPRAPTATERRAGRPASRLATSVVTSADVAAANDDDEEATLSAEMSAEERAERRLTAAARAVAGAGSVAGAVGMTGGAPATAPGQRMGVLLSCNFTVAHGVNVKSFISRLAKVLNTAEVSLEAEADERDAPYAGATLVRTAALLPEHPISLQTAVDAAVSRLSAPLARLGADLNVTMLAAPTFATALVALDAPRTALVLERPGEGRRSVFPTALTTALLSEATLPKVDEVADDDQDDDDQDDDEEDNAPLPYSLLNPEINPEKNGLELAVTTTAAPSGKGAEAGTWSHSTSRSARVAAEAQREAILIREAIHMETADTRAAAAEEKVAALAATERDNETDRGGSKNSTSTSSVRASLASTQLLLANVSVRGDLGSLDIPGFSRRFSGLIGIEPAALEVLGAFPHRAMISREQRAAVVRSQHAAHAAAAALLPEGLPAEVSAALHAAEEATDRAVAVASSPVSGSTLQLRLSATVPRVSATLVANALKSETQALSAALGVEVLRPVAFVMGEHRQLPELDELSSIYKATN